MEICVSKKNTKLGHMQNLSMPRAKTCPGKSEWCEKNCYVKNYENLYPRCMPAYERNYQISLNESEKFVEDIINKINRNKLYFRIHPSGDFYDIKYIQCWIKICSSIPEIKFCAYTRSWINGNLFEGLRELNNLKNTQIILSTDPTMSFPPKDFRIAFLEEDERANGVMCLYYQGKTKTCDKCGFCYKKNISKNIIFKNSRRGKK